MTGFHTDAEGHWVAELECGHGQHLRHDPPWQRRDWVVSPEGRAAFLGTELRCPACGAYAVPGFGGARRRPVSHDPAPRPPGG